MSDFPQMSYKEINTKYQNYFLVPLIYVNQSISYSILQILSDISSCMIQLSLGYICVELMMSINLHFLNLHTTKTNVAAFGIAWMIITVLLLPFGIGLNQALNTLASQAIGMGKNKLSLIYLNFTLSSHVIIFIPLILVILCLKTPFSYLIVEDREETINSAWELIVPLSITSLALLIFEGLKSYLVSCEVFRPFMVIHLITLALHAFWCWLLVSSYGSYGVCLATIISECTNILMLLLYVKQDEDLQIKFKSFQFKFLLLSHFHIYKEYIKSTISIIVHIYLNTGIFIILSFTAISLGIDATNAQLVLSNTSSLYFRVPLCLSIALMTYVGNQISQQHIINAKNYIKYGLILYFCILVVIMIIFYFYHFEWAHFYTKDEVIQEMLLKTLPYFLLGSVAIDGLQIQRVIKNFVSIYQINSITTFSFMNNHYQYRQISSIFSHLLQPQAEHLKDLMRVSWYQITLYLVHMVWAFP